MKKSIKAGIFFATLLVRPILLTSLAINVRTSDNEGFTRIVFEADRPFTYAVQNRPGQVQLRVSGRADFPARTLAWPDSPLLERLTYEIQGAESVFTVFLKARRGREEELRPGKALPRGLRPGKKLASRSRARRR